MLRALRAWLVGAGTERRPYQAPVSWRILPRVLGYAHRVLGQAEAAAEISLAGIDVATAVRGGVRDLTVARDGHLEARQPTVVDIPLEVSGDAGEASGIETELGGVSGGRIRSAWRRGRPGSSFCGLLVDGGQRRRADGRRRWHRSCCCRCRDFRFVWR